MASLTDLEPVGDAIPGDALNPNPQTVGGATDLVFTRRFKVNSTNYADYLYQILSTTAAPATRVTDIKVTDAYLVDQKLQRIDDINSHLVCVFSQLPSTWMTDYTWQNVTMPGVARSRFYNTTDFAFRSSSTSFSTQVRTEHYYQLGPAQAIPRYKLFRPVTNQGLAASTITDTTTPSANEYIAMTARGDEFVAECVIRRWKGDIFTRETRFAVAQ